MRAEISEISSSQALLEPQAAPASISISADRLASVDLLRILAAVGIVWFHTEGVPYRQIGYAGLPVFLLIFFSLITRHNSHDSTGHFLKRRYCRLLKPWLFWSAVYGLCRIVKALHAMDVQELWDMFSIETTFIGTSIHLWYLPYAFMSGLLVHEVNRRTAKADHVVVAMASAIVGVLTLAVCAMGTGSYSLPRPLPQWEFGLAAIPLGLAVGRCLAIPSRRLQRSLLAAICLAILFEGRLLQPLDSLGMMVPYGIAVAAICVAYCWDIGNNGFIAAVAPLTFGIYLIHPLVIYGLNHTLSSGRHCVLFVSLTVCLSALIALVLAKTPVRRFL